MYIIIYYPAYIHQGRNIFMTRSFLFHTYNKIVFMTKSFLLYRKVLHRGFFPNTKIITKLLTNKTTDRHICVPTVRGGSAIL